MGSVAPRAEKEKSGDKEGCLAEEMMSVTIVSIAGSSCASWSGPVSSSVGTIRRHVAEQLSTSVVRVSLIWECSVLRSGTSLQEQGVPDGAVLQLVQKAGVEVQIRTKHYTGGMGRHFW